MARSLPERAPIGRARLACFVALFVALSIGAPLVIYREVGARALDLDGRLLAPGVILPGIALLIAYFGCDGLRLRFTLRALGHALAARDLVNLVFINFLFSNLTPLATGGGFAQIWYLKGRGLDTGTATAATTARTVLATTLVFVPVPFLLWFMGAAGGNPLAARLDVPLGALAVLYLAVAGLVLARPVWFLPLLAAALDGLRACRLIGEARWRRWHFHLRRETLRFSRAIRAYVAGPTRDVALSLLFTALFLISLYSFPALLLRGLGYEAGYATSLALANVATFVAYFAPTPGASGIAESAFGLLFSSLVNGADLVLIVVAWRFLTIYLGMLLGVPVMLGQLMRSGTQSAHRR